MHPPILSTLNPRLSTFSMLNNRQTVSFLRRRFDEVGLFPDRSHGQNFLIDLNLVEFIARSALITPDDVVLEVGTGTGSLTRLLAAQAAAVVTVEIDQNLHRMAAEELEGMTNVIMLQQDALKNKNRIEDRVLAAVQEQLDAAPGRRFKLVSNLPYNIATPIVSNLLRRDPVPLSMTVTIQKELAERIIAQPSTKDYNALSVWIQSLGDAEILRELPPHVFWPRPKVDSAIIQITPRPEKRERIADTEFYHTFVRSLFFHRRKFLRSVVVAAMKDRLDKPQVDAVLAEEGLGPTARAEELDIPVFLRLSEAFRLALEEK